MPKLQMADSKTADKANIPDQNPGDARLAPKNPQSKAPPFKQSVAGSTTASATSKMFCDNIIHKTEDRVAAGGPTPRL